MAFGRLPPKPLDRAAGIRHAAVTRSGELAIISDSFDISRRSDTGLKVRPGPLLLTALVEAVLVLLVLTLGAPGSQHRDHAVESIVAIHAIQPSQDRAVEHHSQKAEALPRPSTATTGPQPQPPTPSMPEHKPAETLPPPALLALSPADMAAANLAALPRSTSPGPPRPRMGPADPSPPMPDTARVSGSGPNGEPLYAAAWYREPYDDELRGYLSTASGPGWGLIACRTAPEYRVEDCIKVDEYPEGSNIARSVLAAAWQFRVRPPRLGGVDRVGEWVRIRIDYDIHYHRR